MQYRAHRYFTHYSIAVDTPFGTKHATVININESGARIEGISGLEARDNVRLRVSGEVIHATVSWAIGQRAGLSFHPRISLYQVDILRQRRDGRVSPPAVALHGIG